MTAPIPAVPWWATVVGYQIYPRSFADSNGDGDGDLNGIRAHLDHVASLGVGAVWINPFYPSPGVDGGYDVSDPRGVDPAFGTLADFDALVADLHRRGIRLVVDLIPNHASSAHPWFAAALAAGPGSRERRRFVFRPGRGDEGEQPPNNWRSVFGGPAWTRVPDGEWYLHLFDPGQPDLDWTDLDVWADLEQTLRFWLDRGVDGIRVDVAHGMAKPAGLPDAPAGSDAAWEPGDPGPETLGGEPVSDDGILPEVHGQDPRFDNVGVHDIHRFIRRVLDDYPDRVAIGEVFAPTTDAILAYLRPDELHQAFSFTLTLRPFDAGEVRAAIDHELAIAAAAGTAPVWTLSNHDVVRPVTRYGGGDLGRQRARAMLLVELALPGAVFLFNGEELGLPSIDVPDEAIQDPAWERSGHTERGRDALRLPLPWSGDTPPFGFSSTPSTWLPSPPEFAGLTVERQNADPSSMLALVRRAIAIRAEHPAASGNEIDWYGAPDGCLAFRRTGGLICALNAGTKTIPLPAGELLLTSGELLDGRLPPDTAAWLV